MKRSAIALICLWLAGGGLQAQESSSLLTENPLTELHDQLVTVLADADLPFTVDQERAVVLMMEERQRASEDLFGDLMDFRDGPTSGRDEDRLRSAIAWLRGEFLTRIANYLTPEQLAEWRRYEEAAGLDEVDDAAGTSETDETQMVRINNNAFTAEDDQFRRGGRGTEVIPRGGGGAFHGTAELFVNDDALNARNAFAANKPPYQERQMSADVGGPIIPGRLTTTFFMSQNQAKNADTINATLPEGDIFSLGITRPQTNRNIGTSGVVQLADAHSLQFNVRYQTNTRENQGIGGFTLPERAYDSRFSNWNTTLEQFSVFSSRAIYETRFQANSNHGESTPYSEDVRVDVLDAFGSGGAQNHSERTGRRYSFGNMFTRYGSRWTLKTGLEGTYRTERSYSTENFGGRFTFSSLDDYNAARAINYRVNRGDPLLELSQFEAAVFMQNDFQLTSRLTVMAGLRYDVQSNVQDRNNVAPRASVAYAFGQSVLRGGGGLFYRQLEIDLFQTQLRFDGTRQVEIVVDNPSYPDPFVSGEVREVLPSIRTTDPGLRNPRVAVAMVSLERSFRNSLQVAVSYDFQRETSRYRLRNLNAPFDVTAPVLQACRPGQSLETCVRPDPTTGNVYNLESTGSESRHEIRVDARQRFSIFNVSGSYSYRHVFADALPWDSGWLATDSYDLDADWARADFPIHQASSTVNARLPLGIFLTAQVEGRTGRRYTITTGMDDNRDSNVNDRPPDVPRNSEVGPDYFNVDLNVSKAFFFGPAGTNVNLFANVRNAFNFVHLGVPSGVLTSPNFGRVTSAFDPREIQLGVRFQF